MKDPELSSLSILLRCSTWTVMSQVPRQAYDAAITVRDATVPIVWPLNRVKGHPAADIMFAAMVLSREDI